MCIRDRCSGAVTPIRPDRLEPALYPLGRNRRSCRRGPQPRSTRRAGRRRRRARRLSRADSAGRRAARASGRAGRRSRARPERRDPGIDGGGRVNAGAACQSRSGRYSTGRRGPEIAPIKPDWRGKKPLGIFPGSDYVPLTTSVQGCWPRRYPEGILRVEARVLRARARPE